VVEALETQLETHLAALVEALGDIEVLLLGKHLEETRLLSHN
jgi:hypothetical protein